MFMAGGTDGVDKSVKIQTWPKREKESVHVVETPLQHKTVYVASTSNQARVSFAQSNIVANSAKPMQFGGGVIAAVKLAVQNFFNNLLGKPPPAANRVILELQSLVDDDDNPGKNEKEKAEAAVNTLEPKDIKDILSDPNWQKVVGRGGIKSFDNVLYTALTDKYPQLKVTTSDDFHKEKYDMGWVAAFFNKENEKENYQLRIDGQSGNLTLFNKADPPSKIYYSESKGKEILEKLKKYRFLKLEQRQTTGLKGKEKEQCWKIVGDPKMCVKAHPKKPVDVVPKDPKTPLTDMELFLLERDLSEFAKKTDLGPFEDYAIKSSAGDLSINDDKLKKFPFFAVHCDKFTIMQQPDGNYTINRGLNDREKRTASLYFSPAPPESPVMRVQSYENIPPAQLREFLNEMHSYAY